MQVLVDEARAHHRVGERLVHDRVTEAAQVLE